MGFVLEHVTCIQLNSHYIALTLHCTAAHFCSKSSRIITLVLVYVKVSAS